MELRGTAHRDHAAFVAFRRLARGALRGGAVSWGRGTEGAACSATAGLWEGREFGDRRCCVDGTKGCSDGL